MVDGTYLTFAVDAKGDITTSLGQPNQALIDDVNANGGSGTPLSDTLYYKVMDASGQITLVSDQFDLGDTSFSTPDAAPFSTPETVDPGTTVNIGGATVSKALSTGQTDNTGDPISVSVGVFDFGTQTNDGQLSVSTDVDGGGGTVTYGHPDGISYLDLTITGTIAEVNADLSTLTYTAVDPGTDALILADVDSPTPLSNIIAGNLEVPCFCRGTRILTPTGETPVEALRIGDAVTTLSGESRPLTWIGSGRTLVTPANPGARPIVVRRGALADGVPVRDLFLTKGHSLLVDGALIPVEFLVNDRTIAWDDTARVVEFYHLELARHDVLLADGAAAESYREDGNRQLFHNADAPLHARPDMPAYAPVLTSGPEVDRAWARLLARAGDGAVELTHESDLHLVADGVRVDGARDGMRHLFHLDRAPFELRIRSRVCNPTRLGTARDPRDLGVAVRRIVLRGNGAELVLGYDWPGLTEGTNAPEPAERIRWTTGDAGMPGRALAAFDGPVAVELELGMTTRYPAPATAPHRPSEVDIAA